MTFTATMADMPSNLSLKARLAWKYFFEDGWAVIHTGDGSYIVTDESLELENATIFPDEDAFVSWLEATASSHINDDPVGFLRGFVSVPELVTESVAREIMKALE